MANKRIRRATLATAALIAAAGLAIGVGATTSSSDWPDATNTGVPAGTTLTAYTGACSISSGTVTIDSKDMSSKCPSSGGGYAVYGTANVTITNSKFATVDVESANARVSITDSEGDGGSQATYSVAITYLSAGTPAPSSGYMLTMTRVNAHGGKDPLECVVSCNVTDSWLHAPYYQDPSGAHQQAILNSGGGTNSHILLTHNTLSCDGTNGCTADLSLFGDFAVVSGATFDNNLFKANPDRFYYCATFGYNPGKAYPNPNNVVVTNNVFEKGSTGVAGAAAVSGSLSRGLCGQAGAVTGWLRAADGGTGNTWTGNTWDDGTVLTEPATG